jgi:cysteine desulfuration protein SufE
MNDFLTFENNLLALKKIFSTCALPQEKYEKIIELGPELPSFPKEAMLEENLVEGCQSQLFLHAYLKNDLFFFTAHSDALISKGLAALLYKVYNGIPPLVIVKNPPVFLKELEITTHLSPSRSNGVISLYFKMQQLALKFLASISV